MDIGSLVLAVLFSMQLTTVDLKPQRQHIKSVEQTAPPSTSCGENCQLPSEPDDDEDEE